MSKQKKNKGKNKSSSPSKKPSKNDDVHLDETLTHATEAVQQAIAGNRSMVLTIVVVGLLGFVAVVATPEVMASMKTRAERELSNKFASAMASEAGDSVITEQALEVVQKLLDQRAKTGIQMGIRLSGWLTEKNGTGHFEGTWAPDWLRGKSDQDAAVALRDKLCEVYADESSLSAYKPGWDEYKSHRGFQSPAPPKPEPSAAVTPVTPTSQPVSSTSSTPAATTLAPTSPAQPAPSSQPAGDGN